MYFAEISSVEPPSTETSQQVFFADLFSDIEFIWNHKRLLFTSNKTGRPSPEWGTEGKGEKEGGAGAAQQAWSAASLLTHSAQAGSAQWKCLRALGIVENCKHELFPHVWGLPPFLRSTRVNSEPNPQATRCSSGSAPVCGAPRSSPGCVAQGPRGRARGFLFHWRSCQGHSRQWHGTKVRAPHWPRGHWPRWRGAWPPAPPVGAAATPAWATSVQVSPVAPALVFPSLRVFKGRYFLNRTPLFETKIRKPEQEGPM